MSRFSGPQGRGAGAADRARKREEADTRAVEAAALRAAEEAAALALAEELRAAELAAAAMAGACEWPWKDAYENPGRAKAAIRRMHKANKGQDLHPYPCPAGHYHLGRSIRRASVAWKAAA